MPRAPIPNDEVARLRSLRSYDVLDTPPERAFDDLALIASHICQTPIALVSLVDEARQWFKARVGLAATDTSRDLAFCAHAILDTALFVVPDASLDSRFADNPLVTEDPRIRFYAGAPLVTHDGNALGTLCVIDRVARELSEHQRNALCALSRQVVAQLELRRSARVLTLALAERARADKRITELLAEAEHGRDNLVAILNQLQVGTVMIDPNGQVAVLSEACQHFLGKAPRQCVGEHWEQLCPFEAADKQQLRLMMNCAQDKRERVSAHLERDSGETYWVEIDVRDDPREPRRKIFYLYDMTAIHDLRRLLENRAQFEGLIGKSKLMVHVYELIRDLAPVDTTVLVEGETGTGKELVAAAVHSLSPRRDGPFIAVNSAGLTESLLASQLFGHKRGAFTGAIDDHKGLFEAANGGTIFLDEIGDIPPSVQANLLRVLQEREIMRIGESKPRKIDVRVIAATNRDLAAEVEKGSFRADLMYRLRVARIGLPALRERREDIPLLVAFFVRELAAATARNVHTVSPAAIRALVDAPWPGNVRELRSAIEFAVIRCKTSVIEETDLPRESLAAADGLDVAAPSDEPTRLREALARAGGNREAAAKLLGISQATLYRRLAALRIADSR